MPARKRGISARRLHPGARRAPADHAWHSGATRSRRSDVLWSRLRGPDQAFGLPEVLVAVSTSRLSCKRAGKTRTLMPVWDSSGESRLCRALDPRVTGREVFVPPWGPALKPDPSF